MRTPDAISCHKTKSENVQEQQIHNEEAKFQTCNGRGNNNDPYHVVKDESN